MPWGYRWTPASCRCISWPTHVKLFNALYDRHARRAFARLSRDHFYWPRGMASHELIDAMGEGQQQTVFRTSAKVSMLLTCIPQVLPFRQRVKIFQRLVDGDKAAHGLRPLPLPRDGCRGRDGEPRVDLR